MADGLNRVFLWGVPRTMSTAIAKCLSHVDGMQIVNQPYSAGHYMGPQADIPEPDLNNPVVCRILAMRDKLGEQCSKGQWSGLDASLMSYQWIRDEILEAPYPDKKVLLCKEQAQYLNGRYDMLPLGFKYSFLIRHPIKVFRSYKVYLTNVWGDFSDMRALPPMMFPPGCGFKELYDLVEYVKENIDPQPTILDADDLLQDPAGILSTYCTRMGIPYSSNLLCWEPGSDITRSWIMSNVVLASNDVMSYYKHAIESEGFGKPTPIPDLASLPDDVQACVKFSMSYYTSLHRERIKAPVS